MGCLPTLAMLAVQAGFAGMNLLSKLSLDTGMSPFVLIACRSFIAAGVLAPIALYYERNLWATMSRRVILEIFISSTLGMSLSELLYFLGFQSTTPTVASALGNLVPALTFLIAAAAKVETLRLKTRAGQAKVAGTVVCLGGSMVMLLCKGPLLRIWASPLHWRYAEEIAAAAASKATGSRSAVSVGDVLIILSCVAWAGWLVQQNETSQRFAAPYTSTIIMSLIVGVEFAVVSAAVDRRAAVWELGSGIRLYSVLYMGIVGWGATFVVMTWCIKLRGPLFVSMFNPVVLVVCAVLGWAFLGEKIHLGDAVGSVLIVAGLYMVLWGKAREARKPAHVEDGAGAGV
ncbi:WAT1-related protein At1g09380-like [Triticum dicoccoides]|uniref:WAT1-related protein At1g09380-like n=1 Tax=Triticum dicoccoides TaxID=85692 RepID=UPI001890E3BB|nr:WAT1-related protein At1g09380-like [Triticum dicoccoides]